MLKLTFRQKIFLFCAMACAGMTTEIFFTAIYDAITGKVIAMDGETVVKSRLLGYSYIWMFPIYGSAGIIFPVLYKLISARNVLLRMGMYGAAILAVEFATGWLLDGITGQCPWEYKEGWQVMGYIRLDFFPLWSVFAWGAEKLLLFLTAHPVFHQPSAGSL